MNAFTEFHIKSLAAVICHAALVTLGTSLFPSHSFAQHEAVPDAGVFGDSVEIGRWTLRSDDEVALLYSANVRSQYMTVDGEIARMFGDGVQVQSVVFGRERSLCLLHLARWDASLGGLCYDKLVLVIDRSSTESGKLETADLLPSSRLENVDGYRVEVVNVGSLDSFPIVDLYVVMQDLEMAAPLSEFQWQTWDLKTQRMLGRVEAREAEDRERAVHERGDRLAFDRD